MMMSHRQEQLLFPELKHMDLSPHFKTVSYSMRQSPLGQLGLEIFLFSEIAGGKIEYG